MPISRPAVRFAPGLMAASPSLLRANRPSDHVIEQRRQAGHRSARPSGASPTPAPAPALHNRRQLTTPPPSRIAAPPEGGEETGTHPQDLLAPA